MSPQPTKCKRCGIDQAKARDQYVCSDGFSHDFAPSPYTPDSEVERIERLKIRQAWTAYCLKNRIINVIETGQWWEEQIDTIRHADLAHFQARMKEVEEGIEEKMYKPGQPGYGSQLVKGYNDGLGAALSILRVKEI